MSGLVTDFWSVFRAELIRSCCCMRCRYPVALVSAVHVHHGLSPSADDWTSFCEDLCRAWLIELSVERVTVERDSADGLEAAARRARHAAYDRTAADWLLLAHHQGDRAETMLFNLLRGAGVRGAGALRERSGRILRPLLGVGRPAIIAYANAHGLRWVEDDSNSDLQFSRNFLRHRVLPLIEERFPAGSARLAAAAGHFAEAADLLDELALADLAASGPDFPVDVALTGRTYRSTCPQRAALSLVTCERRHSKRAAPDRSAATVPERGAGSPPGDHLW